MNNFLYLVLALAGFQIISGYSISPAAVNLSGSEKLDELYELSWNILENEKTIYFNVSARTVGWVGFGLSPSGGMTGADLFIGGVWNNGTLYGSDYHGVGNTRPVEDTLMDWILDEGHENGTHTFISFHRLLNTCDDDDIEIADGTMRVIWAIGAADDFDYHLGARGLQSINFYLGNADDFPADEFNTLDITMTVEMPAQHTTHWCTIQELPEFTEKRHVVAFEPIIDNPDALEHTFLLAYHRCIAPEGVDPENFFKPWTHEFYPGDHCYDKNKNEEFPFDRYCSGNIVYTWSKGGKRIVFPENIGYPIPENVGVKEYYALEVHYENHYNQAKTFKTGGRIYHTDKLRPVEAGLMVVQHKTGAQLTIPPKSEDFLIAGHCSGECTQNLLPENGITAFNVMLNAHLTGRKIKLRHFRGNEELEWVAKEDYFDFDFQQNRQLNKPKKIEKGDQLTIECIYNSMNVAEDIAVTGGRSLHDEVCQALIYYWPRLENVAICGSAQDPENHFESLGYTEWKEVESGNDIQEFEIVKPENLAGQYLESVSKKVNWTPEIRAKYQQEKRFGEQISYCMADRKETKIDITVKYPENLKEYVPDDDCNAVTETPPTVGPTTAPPEDTTPIYDNCTEINDPIVKLIIITNSTVVINM